MKKIIVCMLLCIPICSFSQSRILEKIKQKARDRAEQRVDGAIDKTMDQTEKKVEDGVKSSTKKGTTDKQPAEKDTVKEPVKADPGTPSNTALKSFSRYDFIPGERIVYAEDFAGDEIGELPLKWITNNRAEAVTLGQTTAKWMRLFSGSRIASPPAGKLPENFTVEADILFQFSGDGGYVYPELEIKLLDLLAGDQYARSYVVNQDASNEVSLVLQAAGAGKPLSVSLRSYVKGQEYFSNQIKELKLTTENGNKPLHISIWVQKERVRYWINSEKVFDIPQAIPAKATFSRLGLNVESSLYTEEQLGLFISNIKIAEGTPDMRNKLITEGRFVTNGILFDVNSDKIRPESAGVLKSIAGVLAENSTMRIKIIGHTDSDGDAAGNIDLSKRRAKAVRAALQSVYGIDVARIETDGLGESKPVSDNATNEGKARNRRVEFIKL
ncbi:MAG: OmpA family protein [Chitinophagaceae bacterium]|nr:OmpA family protein [Chitinophagaceae bacterium]